MDRYTTILPCQTEEWHGREVPANLLVAHLQVSVKLSVLYLSGKSGIISINHEHSSLVHLSIIEELNHETHT
ncbi:hypothetical protein HZS38_14795 [Xenorhabdus nematophila]|uniref:Uncharacterized protein n=1 Tax=Xenorhabdus nematophila (strain ATCC 19061 / DSM 3370 / CCUG 14189 / LMG 1036 / NCIMB 9965 / AN6) TaxID=406817 RepID=D3VG83_XENNA|nr:hypothetical protein [Xenorhabdus nematophila]CEE94183.1 hypothetical protein XNA1_4520017 [Xenorhabdus nematophila str. Anatoliense]CEF30972.1 hypothetical protein XNW1_30017 [Xenorhabdus nematophila str. Websteri]AYA41611.1 hypothetical protein D3790_15185 [Xenorhabdus nematophila]KHD28322.1 hypothetical protein LH67_11490 [Xenorhabdus nematophila]MBA0020349.1 hypothetical protein [Xenorhabdus nematophila]